MPHDVLAVVCMLTLSSAAPVPAQAAPRTLVAILAHGDDEGAAAPVLARYARQGALVFMIIATDGSQGGTHTSIPRGPELAAARAEEARCAAKALGIQPPILLEFPDGKLGDHLGERAVLYRLTTRLAKELARLRPDAMITWGPDGGTGHPDHRLVSALATQLARSGAPGVPERLFYMSLPPEGMSAMNPQRGTPPMLSPPRSTSPCALRLRRRTCTRGCDRCVVTGPSIRTRS
jgi:LmbE family N-acetylglucosaminyl deacetylase